MDWTSPKASSRVQGAFNWSLFSCRHINLSHNWRWNADLIIIEEKMYDNRINPYLYYLKNISAYPKSPACTCIWLCRIPWPHAGSCCSTAQSERWSLSRPRWDQSDRDKKEDKNENTTYRWIDGSKISHLDLFGNDIFRKKSKASRVRTYRFYSCNATERSTKYWLSTIVLHFINNNSICVDLEFSRISKSPLQL